MSYNRIINLNKDKKSPTSSISKNTLNSDTKKEEPKNILQNNNEMNIQSNTENKDLKDKEIKVEKVEKIEKDNKDNKDKKDNKNSKDNQNNNNNQQQQTNQNQQNNQQQNDTESPKSKPQITFKPFIRPHQIFNEQQNHKAFADQSEDSCQDASWLCNGDQTNHHCDEGKSRSPETSRGKYTPDMGDLIGKNLPDSGLLIKGKQCNGYKRCKKAECQTDEQKQQTQNPISGFLLLFPAWKCCHCLIFGLRQNS